MDTINTTNIKQCLHEMERWSDNKYAPKILFNDREIDIVKHHVTHNTVEVFFKDGTTETFTQQELV